MPNPSHPRTAVDETPRSRSNPRHQNRVGTDHRVMSHNAAGAHEHTRLKDGLLPHDGTLLHDAVRADPRRRGDTGFGGDDGARVNARPHRTSQFEEGEQDGKGLLGVLDDDAPGRRPGLEDGALSHDKGLRRDNHRVAGVAKETDPAAHGPLRGRDAQDERLPVAHDGSTQGERNILQR